MSRDVFLSILLYFSCCIKLHFLPKYLNFACKLYGQLTLVKSLKITDLLLLISEV